MKTELRKKVEAALKDIHKMYKSALWGKKQTLSYEDEVISFKCTIKYHSYPTDCIDYNFIDFKKTIHSKSPFVADVGDRTIMDSIVDDAEKYGVQITQLLASYDDICNAIGNLDNLLMENGYDLDIYDFILDDLSEGYNMTDFVNGMLETIGENEPEPSELQIKSTVRLNGSYSATVKSNGEVLVGCQTIPIDNVRKVVKAYDTMKKQ